MPHSRRYAARSTLAALCLAALTACSDGRFSGGPALDFGLDLVGLGPKDPPPAPAQPSIGAPLIVGYQTVRVAIPNTGISGQSKLYVAPDGVEIAMNNGHVTRVIGLGIDLEGMFLPADSPYSGNFVQAAKAGAVTERVADYYRKGDILHDSYRCALNFTPREGNKGIVTERCRRFFGGPGFENTYWTTGDTITCSLQWFHPDGDKLQFFQTAQQAQALDLNREGC